MADIRVSFACNSHLNGLFRGEFEAIDFDGDGYHVGLVGPETFIMGRSKSPGAVPHQIRIGERGVYAIRDYKTWEGNWCWDACSMSHDDARKLLTQLLKLGFVVEEFTEGGPLADLVEARANG